MSNIFLPSMIEVEFGDYYKFCAELLFKNGFNSFHIDFGDNKLIGRELQCWDKVNFLKSLGPDIKLTAHIMSMSGDHSLSVENISSQCLEAGFEIIYIHSRSFKNFNELLKFKEIFFKKNHHVFGVVSELQNNTNSNLIKFVYDNSIKNLLQMGVPIGKGGQKFGSFALERIEEFSSRCTSLSNIELDGGLTFDVVKNIENNKINRLAGWSIISDENPSAVLSKAFEVKELI